MADLKITGPADALEVWRRADAENDMETMRLVEDVVFLKLDPADIARMTFDFSASAEDFREHGFETKEAFVAEADRAARSCLMAMWNNGKARAEPETMAGAH